MKRPNTFQSMILAACIGACVWVGAWAAVAHAKPPAHKLAPPWVCTMENRMEAFIDEDDIMWECMCEALKTGHICHWQVVGGVDAPAVRKLPRHTHRKLIPVLLVRMPAHA